MKAARLYAAGDVRIQQEEIPRTGADESLVRVTAVGVCGSDLHWFTEGSIGDATLTKPLVLGHEIAGIVTDGPMTGRRVAVDPAVPCFACHPCREGNPHLCDRIVFAGHGGTDGGMREYLSWPSDRLHPLPDSIDDASGAVLEPLGVAIHAMDLARPRLASTVAIVGCGPIGALAIQLARLSGAGTVIAVDPLAHRRSLAATVGADVVGHPDQARDLTREATTGRGADVVVEIAGTDSAVDLAVGLAKPAARLILAGIPDGDTTTFVASAARRKGLTILLARRMKEVYDRAILLASRGRVDLRAVISDEVPLADAAVALRHAATRAGHKTVLIP
jgi:L-iditol 2-dehydrogenase